MERNRSSWRGRILGWALFGILALSIFSALGMLGYTIARPSTGERFTEFYLLDLAGEAKDYPGQLAVGEEGRVMVGIINREQETVTYRIEVEIDGVKSNEVGPLTLESDEKWQEVVGFIPEKTGEQQKVEFLLYKPGASEAYRKLHLWVNVR